MLNPTTTSLFDNQNLNSENENLSTLKSSIAPGSLQLVPTNQIVATGSTDKVLRFYKIGSENSSHETTLTNGSSLEVDNLQSSSRLKSRSQKANQK